MRERMLRFDKYMKFMGLNDNQVTVQCGLSKGLIGQARTGRSDLGVGTVNKILKEYQDLNRVWLLTGEGEMLRKAGQVAGQHYSIGDVSGSHNAFGSKTVSVRTRDGDEETIALLRQQIELLQRQNEQQARQNEQQARMIETLTRLLDTKGHI